MRRLLVLGTLALALACGRKGPVIPPELARPEPAASLSGAPAADGIRLTWLRPERYSGGQRMRDLRGFVIERAPADDPTAPFTRVGIIELEDQTRFRPERRIEWTDTTAVPGARYRYRVIARTLDGYSSRPAGPVVIRFRATPAAPAEETP